MLLQVTFAKALKSELKLFLDFGTYERTLEQKDSTTEDLEHLECENERF